MTKYISELLQEVNDTKGRKAKSEVLKENESRALRYILAYGLHPNVRFFTNTIPPYTPDDGPIGVNPNNLFRAWRQFYVFLDDHPCDNDRKEKVLIQLMEGLHEDEARVVEQVIRRKGFEARGLTPNLVKMTFPGLLGEAREGDRAERNAEHNEMVEAAKRHANQNAPENADHHAKQHAK